MGGTEGAAAAERDTESWVVGIRSFVCVHVANVPPSSGDDRVIERRETEVMPVEFRPLHQVFLRYG